MKIILIVVLITVVFGGGFKLGKDLKMEIMGGANKRTAKRALTPTR